MVSAVSKSVKCAEGNFLQKEIGKRVVINVVSCCVKEMAKENRCNLLS